MSKLVNRSALICKFLKQNNHPFASFIHEKLDFTIYPLDADKRPEKLAQYKPYTIAIPKGRKTEEPESNTVGDFYPLELVELIGSYGWNWVDKVAEYVVFDLDSFVGHSKGLSEKELEKAIAALKLLGYVTIYRSKSGNGYHAYVFLKTPLPAPTRKAHQEWRKAVFNKMMADSGLNLKLIVDKQHSGNAWIYTHKPKSKSFALVHQGKPFDGELELPTRKARKEIVGVVSGEFDLAEWLNRCEYEFEKSQTEEGETKIVFRQPRCPWRPDESDGNAYGFIRKSGQIEMYCGHQSCADESWQTLWNLHEDGEAPCSVLESPYDPDRLGRIFLQESNINSCPIFCWVSGQLHKYNKNTGKWESRENKTFEIAVRDSVRREYRRLAKGKTIEPLKARDLHDVVSAVNGQMGPAYHFSKKEPKWFKPTDIDPWECLCFPNGILHIPMYAEARNTENKGFKITEPTPNYFCVAGPSYRFDPNAEVPSVLLETMQEWWDNDEESKRLFQEQAGDSILPLGIHHAIFSYFGPGGTGKSLAMDLLDQLVGDGNYKTLSRSQRGQFALSILAERPRRLVTREGDNVDDEAVTTIFDTLLSVCTGESQDIDKKYNPERLQGKYPVNVTVSHNGQIKGRDFGNAKKQRIQELRWLKVFRNTAKEDKQRIKKLEAALPGVFNWAVDGWWRLQKQKGYTLTAVTESAREMFEEATDPLAFVLKNEFEEVPDYGFFTPTEVIAQRFKQFLGAPSNTVLDTRQLGQAVRTHYPNLIPDRKILDGCELRGFWGLRCKASAGSLPKGANFRPSSAALLTWGRGKKTAQYPANPSQN